MLECTGILLHGGENVIAVAPQLRARKLERLPVLLQGCLDNLAIAPVLVRRELERHAILAHGCQQDFTLASQLVRDVRQVQAIPLHRSERHLRIGAEHLCDLEERRHAAPQRRARVLGRSGGRRPPLLQQTLPLGRPRPLPRGAPPLGGVPASRALSKHLPVHPVEGRLHVALAGGCRDGAPRVARGAEPEAPVSPQILDKNLAPTALNGAYQPCT
mmetsp:Transcript_2206/g.7008  ORF Transcript_2206/g.7008 Transcript_2206/m.7008 type:complete len:216 (+) Transcript_2206:1685-2332(+)